MITYNPSDYRALGVGEISQRTDKVAFHSGHWEDALNGHMVTQDDDFTVLRPLPEAPAPQAGPRTLPVDAAARKALPLVTGVLDYFPDSLLAVAQCSKAGNDQHNPGKPLFWDRSKSGDEADALGRHLLQRGTMDKDGVRHSAKLAWRALALLQKEIEAEQGRSL